MTNFGQISVAQLARLIGTPDCPLIFDVRTDTDLAADPRLIPTGLHLAHAAIYAHANPARHVAPPARISASSR